MNLTHYAAPETPPQQVIATCNTLPWMAQRRIVVVKDAHLYSKGELAAFEEYLRSPSPTTALILVSEGTSQDLLRLARDAAFLLKRPTPKELIPWIHTLARELQKELSPEAASYFKETSSGDLQALYQELLKAALYVGERKRIELGDVQAVTSEGKTATVFDLTRAIGQRDLKGALAALRVLWDEGEPPLKILAMISRQFRHLLIANEVISKGGGKQELMQMLGINNPYTIRELIDQARRFSQESLCRAIRSLWEADLKVKKSPLPRRLIFEGLIIELTRT